MDHALSEKSFEGFAAARLGTSVPETGSGREFGDEARVEEM